MKEIETIHANGADKAISTPASEQGALSSDEARQVQVARDLCVGHRAIATGLVIELLAIINRLTQRN